MWSYANISKLFAGPDVFFGSQDMMDFEVGYAEMGPYSVDVNTQEQDVQTDRYQEDYNFVKNDEERVESEQTFSQTGNCAMEDNEARPSIAPNPSKLQASLKKGERRNKKKRPPGYYSQLENEPSYATNSHLPSNDNTQIVVRSEVHVNLSNQPEGAYYSENRQDNIVETNFKMNDPSGFQHNVPTYQNIQDDQYIQDTSLMNAQNSAIHPNIGAQYGDTKMDELNEVVVVESVPYSDAHGQQGMEIKQIQDHDRTTKLTQSLNSVSDASSFTHSSLISSDKDVYVSKLQIPNLGSPNKMDIFVNDNVALSANSSQVPESFQASSQIDEKVSQTEFSTDTQQQPSSDSIETDSNVAKDDSKLEANISVDTSLTTAKDASKPDIINSPLASAESPKPQPQPAKPTSWAGLFKSSSVSSSNPPAFVPVTEGVKEDNSSDKKEVEERNEKEMSPMPVPAAEDKEAKTLGGKSREDFGRRHVYIAPDKMLFFFSTKKC